jgi:septation ring formation regulator EzrA
MKAKPTITLDKSSQQSLSNTESTVQSVYDDLTDIGDQVDISKMTLEQLKEEFKKFRREHDTFKWEVKQIIGEEIEKHMEPLIKEMKLLTTKKTSTVYIQKFRILPLANIKEGCAKILYAIKKVFTRRA